MVLNATVTTFLRLNLLYFPRYAPSNFRFQSHAVLSHTQDDRTRSPIRPPRDRAASFPKRTHFSIPAAFSQTNLFVSQPPSLQRLPRPRSTPPPVAASFPKRTHCRHQP